MRKLLQQAAQSISRPFGNRPAQGLRRACRNQNQPRFTRGSSRKIRLRPNKPFLQPLKFRKQFVRVLDGHPRHGSFRLRTFFHKQNRQRLGTACTGRNHDAIAHASLLAQRRFNVLWINIQSGRRHDDVFLAALEPKIAFGIEFPDIAREQPPFAAFFLLNSSALPITGGNIFAAHKNFAILCEPKLAPGQNFSDRALRGAKGMIQADERCGFRHAVALHDRVTYAFEELFGFGGERRTAGNEGPELPAKPTVNAAESPGAAQEFFAVRRVKSFREPAALSARFAIRARSPHAKHRASAAPR